MAQQTRLPLTQRQRDVYDFLVKYAAEHGWAPTVREIQTYFVAASVSGTYGHLKALEKKGWIVRTAGHARLIRFTEPTGLRTRMPIFKCDTAGRLLPVKKAEQWDLTPLLSPATVCVVAPVDIDSEIRLGDYLILKPAAIKSVLVTVLWRTRTGVFHCSCAADVPRGDYIIGELVAVCHYRPIVSRK